MNIFKRKPKQQDLTDLSDNELVTLAKDSKEAFGVLYERYVEKIYKYIYYRTGNHQDAEDLAAAVFFRAMGHIADYTDRGVPFQAWLYRIAHNLVANWHRDRGRRKIIPLEEFVNSGLHFDAPDSAAEDKEERQQLLKAIETLPEERQQLLYLKFVAGLSNAEVGDILDRTEGAIKSLYHRTLIALRDDIQMQEANVGARREAPENTTKRKNGN
jgi:RNA polymerase sigma-70 factor, ECF subfamily